MVHALEEIHRLLKPDGCLIAIRPDPLVSLIEVHTRGQVLFAEAVPVPAYDLDVISKAEQALVQVIQRGLFVVETSRAFEFLQYGSSTEELTDHFAWTNAFHEWPEDEAASLREVEVYARVAEIMPTAGEAARVASHERARIARLRPVKR